MTEAPTFPRRVTGRLWWMGACNESVISGKPFHVHMGIFLMVGSERTMLVDTVTPTYWPEIERQLAIALGGRKLDYVFPTHPEVPHVSALPLICKAYPEARVLADSRDYHLYFPDLLDRVDHKRPGDEVDLGDLKFVFLPGLMKDLPNTLWGYERTEQVMFVSDGFSFAHASIGGEFDDDAMHRPGECAMLTSELESGVDVEKASFLLRAALYWSRFVDAGLLFKGVDKLLEDYPTRIIAPAHGNVVDQIDTVTPIIRAVHEHAFESAMAGKFVESGDHTRA